MIACEPGKTCEMTSDHDHPGLGKFMIFETLSIVKSWVAPSIL
jgi:hypothetical protein